MNILRGDFVLFCGSVFFVLLNRTPPDEGKEVAVAERDRAEHAGGRLIARLGRVRFEGLELGDVSISHLG